MLKVKIIMNYLLPIFIIVLSIVSLALNEIAICVSGCVVFIPSVMRILYDKVK